MHDNSEIIDLNSSRLIEAIIAVQSDGYCILQLGNIEKPLRGIFEKYLFNDNRYAYRVFRDSLIKFH